MRQQLLPISDLQKCISFIYEKESNIAQFLENKLGLRTNTKIRWAGKAQITWRLLFCRCNYANTKISLIRKFKFRSAENSAQCDIAQWNALFADNIAHCPPLIFSDYEVVFADKAISAKRENIEAQTAKEWLQSKHYWRSRNFTPKQIYCRL